MNNDSYHMPTWIGIGIRISMSVKFLALYVYDIESIGKIDISPPLCMIIRAKMNKPNIRIQN